MKTGFICASGFNLVATATRDNKQLIAVVLGAPSSLGARGEGGGTAGERLYPEPAVVADAVAWPRSMRLAPIDASPPNLKDEMCGPHRKRPATEEDEAGSAATIAAALNRRRPTPQFSVLLSACAHRRRRTCCRISGPMIPDRGLYRPDPHAGADRDVGDRGAADPVKKKSSTSPPKRSPPKPKRRP